MGVSGVDNCTIQCPHTCPSSQQFRTHGCQALPRALLLTSVLRNNALTWRTVALLSQQSKAGWGCPSTPPGPQTGLHRAGLHGDGFLNPPSLEPSFHVLWGTVATVKALHKAKCYFCKIRFKHVSIPLTIPYLRIEEIQAAEDPGLERPTDHTWVPGGLIAQLPPLASLRAALAPDPLPPTPRGLACPHQSPVGVPGPEVAPDSHGSTFLCAQTLHWPCSPHTATPFGAP